MIKPEFWVKLQVLSIEKASGIRGTGEATDTQDVFLRNLGQMAGFD